MIRSEGQYRCSLGHTSISMEFKPNSSMVAEFHNLTIVFLRVLHIPENELEGRRFIVDGFPLFKIRDYAHRLPPEMTAKGGVFTPIYRREGMVIKFDAETPFMIKVYAGGVNVVSGESSAETQETWRRRSYLDRTGKNIQDYIAAHKQYAVDDIAISPGVVRRIVAIPSDSGYSVEAQLTREDAPGNFRLEITPLFFAKYPVVSLVINTLEGGVVNIRLHWYSTISKVRDIVYAKRGVQLHGQKLVHEGKELSDHDVLGDLLTEDGNTVEINVEKTVRDVEPKSSESLPSGFGTTAFGPLAIRGRRPDSSDKGGDKLYEEFDLEVVPSGTVPRFVEKDDMPASCWASDMTIAIPVHIFNSATFRRVTGTEMPPTLVEPSVYAEMGYTYLFEKYEEPSAVAGDFDPIKFVNETNHGEVDQSGERITIPNRTALPIDDPDGLIDPEGPLRPFRAIADVKEELENERRRFRAAANQDYSESGSTARCV
ncbi:hypothetical protein K449DRAFT_469082 [Hypoxylon sp. EC38]|nr:hypothetical protein K449DRAFT_469082 [Hypoxylon sp. EC38]